MSPRLIAPMLAVALAVAACTNSTATGPSTVAVASAPATSASGPTSNPLAAESTSTTAPPTAATTATTTTAAPAAATTAPPTAASTATGVDPNAPEVVEPGDIPDNQVFVPYRPPGASFQVKVPEGWAQTASGATTTFTDHYNAITITSAVASAAPTVGDVRNIGLADVATNPTFRLVDVTAVRRRSGPGVLATYELGSDPNPVTGKRALLAVERYEFFHNATLVTLTLSGAKGADNVDPWRTVTDSLTWP
jgi:hypothetical protein